jgi:hypothetical protein
MAARRIIQRTVILSCFLQLALGLGSVRPAWADNPEVNMFYEALASHGSWVDYGKYGPVWYPTKVSSSWRPYLDGRWMPSRSGWVFETSEPWGWATYHYGNWMPTTELGWVWSPGSTWYPSTTAWRTSDDYVGWAPIPPPDYVPEPAFYPAGGYAIGAPLLDRLAAPLWTFARAGQFLLGFGRPYGPAFSYFNCSNCLAPFSYAPIVYGGTFPLTDFYYPSYAPLAFFGFGPPFPFVSRVSRINIVQINNFINSNNFTVINNVLPSGAVLGRFPFLRGAIPAGVLEGGGFPITRVQDAARAEHGLNRPGVLAPPSGLPVISQAIPKFTPTRSIGAVGPEGLGGIKGMALPRQAERPLTPFMRQQISAHRQMQGLPRIETLPEFRPLARPETAPQVEVIRGVTSQKFHRPGPGGFQPAPGPTTPGVVRGAPGVTTPEVVRGAPSRKFQSPGAREFQPAPSGEFRQPAGGGVRAVSPRKFRLSSGGSASVPREFRAAPPPVSRSEPRATVGTRPMSPAPRGTPPTRTFSSPSQRW